MLWYKFYFSSIFFLTVCYYHVTYTFQSESRLYSCLNIKKVLAQNRRDIWNLSDSNGIRTHCVLRTACVLVSSETQVQLQVKLDPDYLQDYLSFSYDYGSMVNSLDEDHLACDNFRSWCYIFPKHPRTF